MLILGSEFLVSIADAGCFAVKMVFNARGAIVFGADREHRDMKATGISYEDDYRGDALAAMLSPGRIEVRYHERFTDDEVARLVGQLQRRAELWPLSGCVVTYQGRRVETGSRG